MDAAGFYGVADAAFSGAEGAFAGLDLDEEDAVDGAAIEAVEDDEVDGAADEAGVAGVELEGGQVGDEVLRDLAEGDALALAHVVLADGLLCLELPRIELDEGLGAGELELLVADLEEVSLAPLLELLQGVVGGVGAGAVLVGAVAGDEDEDYEQRGCEQGEEDVIQDGVPFNESANFSATIGPSRDNKTRRCIGKIKSRKCRNFFLLKPQPSCRLLCGHLELPGNACDLTSQR